jgi:hypothetical protein
MKIRALTPLRTAAIVLLLTGGASHADATPPATPAIPTVAPDCLDLGAYLDRIRALPDSLTLHHQLLDVSISATDDSAQVSALAEQHALDIFFHPNLAVLGLAAGKNGTPYSHAFHAYQSDCSKVVTGNLFSDDTAWVRWQVTGHTANSITLKRLTKDGGAEPHPDLSLVMRRFVALNPNVFAVTSLYALKAQHACKAPSPAVSETDGTVVTELYAVTDGPQALAVPMSDGLQALMAKHPRLDAGSGVRGDFVHPVTAETDTACAPAAPATGAPTP